jgi:CheY-like chemotaxis protein
MTHTEKAISEQQEAISKLIRFLKNPNVREILFTGPAGTGKTKLITDLIINNGINLDTTLFAAISNKALEILKTNYPDVIILDVMMPMVDGYATLEQIRKDTNLSHTKVMFLSAKNKESDIEKGMALGADAYLTKPFSIKKVVDQVADLLA